MAVAFRVAPLAAQDSTFTLPEQTMPDSAPVDFIVAVVGNSVILNSQVAEEMFQQQTAGRVIPDDPAGRAAVREEILNDLVDVELAVQQAEQDTSIQVTPQEVASAVEQNIRNIRSRVPTEQEYRIELEKAGFATPEEYRRWLTDQQRRVLLHNKLIEKLRGTGQLEPVSPTDDEMRAYFEQARGQLGKRPATISFHQVVVAPKASPEAMAGAEALADSIAVELRAGGDFATAARRFSDDPGSAEKGGDLGWFRREAMIPEFSQVAFSIKPGVVSYPVKSAFGFHIIQVQRVQPTEVQARHILIAPEVTQVEADSAKALAERIRTAVIAGASFDSLQRLYHDRAEEKSVEVVPLGQLPQPYPTVLADADSAEVPPVLELPGQPGSFGKYAVIEVTG
ncbi:MAG: peptidylprolyl isomerase, partial [Gemmatimonadales bacterium]